MPTTDSPARPLRVLLLSPRRTGGSIYSGEDAYTDSLLQSPPPGVAYTHYEDLIRSGRARRLRWLQRYIVRAAPWAGGPIWLETLGTDEPFDLIHIHAFSARLAGGIVRRGTPVVLSESSLDLENLIDYDGWTRAAVEQFAPRKRWALRVIGAYDQTLNPRDARRLVLWSDWARQLHRRWGASDDWMTVVPPQVSAVPPLLTSPALADSPPHFLFVGGDFHRKNGAMVVAAFHRAKAALPPGARLTVVGGRDGTTVAPAEGIVQYRELSRERIVNELYPQASVFVMPSRADGYGIAVIEAMSAGVPCIVSSSGVLAEIVGDTGIVVDVTDSSDSPPESAVDRLAASMLHLGSDPARRAALGIRARERYQTHWSSAATGSALLGVYRQALDESTP